jgi:hypothetical protein
MTAPDDPDGKPAARAADEPVTADESVAVQETVAVQEAVTADAGPRADDAPTVADAPTVTAVRTRPTEAPPTETPDGKTDGREAGQQQTEDKAEDKQAADKVTDKPAAEKQAAGKQADQEPAKAPADWEHFAPSVPAPPRQPGRSRRAVTHEWTIASVVALAFSAVINRGALLHPTTTLPQDSWDPSLTSYLMAWVGHALLNDPASLWHPNAFYPSPYALAYSDPLLGYAPAALIGSGPTAAVLRYNILFVLAHALVLLGGYLLARQVGLARVGAAVTAVAIAMAPWRLAQAGHLNILSTGGVLLALAMLARGHGIRLTGDRAGPARPGWALAGWLVATWQLSLGFATGLVFLYVLLGAFVVGVLALAARGWRPRPPLRLVLANAAGGGVFAATAVLLAQPYLKVLELYPSARRDAEWIEMYSPPWRGLLTAPAESWLWGGLHETARAELPVPAEMALLPGFALLALAAAGVFFSVLSIPVRVGLVIGVGVTAMLALGTRGPAEGELGYLVLLDTLPGFEGLRTPGRLILWATIGLALLAGGGVAALVDRATDTAQTRGLPRPTLSGRLALLIPLGLVLIEGLGTTPHVAVPQPPAVLATVPAPYLVLPSDVNDAHVMLWSTDRFAPLVNGESGVMPAELERTRQEILTFPDAASVAYLRELGVRTVVVPTATAAGTPWAEAATMSVAGLPLRREVTDDAVLFHLN